MTLVFNSGNFRYSASPGQKLCKCVPPESANTWAMTPIELLQVGDKVSLTGKPGTQACLEIEGIE